MDGSSDCTPGQMEIHWSDSETKVDPKNLADAERGLTTLLPREFISCIHIESIRQRHLYLAD